MAVAVAYGLGWVVATVVVGGGVGFLGGVAKGFLGLGLWSLSGIAVGAAQWALVRRRLHVSPIPWISATAIGSFVTVLTHLYLATRIVGSSGRLDLTTAYAPEFLFQGLILAVVSGLSFGVPQAAALCNTSIRSSAWILAATSGALATLVLSYSYLILGPMHWPLPREIGTIALAAGYWGTLCLPQSVLIGRALRGKEDGIPFSG